MKNTIKFLTVLVIAVSFTFTACSDDLLDVDFTTSITEKIPITIDQGQEIISESAILSLDNSDTNKYLNKIKNVEITKLTYKIITFSGDESGSLDVEFNANDIVLDNIDFNVKNAYSNVTIFEVTDVAKLNEMANLLKKNKQVTVGVNGNCSALEDAMDFTIEVTVALNVTANPL